MDRGNRGHPWAGSDRLARLPSGWKTRIRPQILKRDSHRCQLRYADCTMLATHVDHIEPGDDHSPANLQAVCESCHLKKSSQEGNAARPPLHRPRRPHPGLRRR